MRLIYDYVLKINLFTNVKSLKYRNNSIPIFNTLIAENISLYEHFFRKSLLIFLERRFQVTLRDGYEV